MTWALVPSLIAGIALCRVVPAESWPAAWLVLYGCGALTTSFFAPRSIARLGACCLALGVVALVVLPVWPLWTMGIGFGATHVVFGACVLAAEQREKRERAFWASLEELA